MIASVSSSMMWRRARRAASCSEAMRVRSDALDRVPSWQYDPTLAAEAHNVTLLQLHALGFVAAVPRRWNTSASPPPPTKLLFGVAAARVRLHHAARVIQRAWRRASNDPEHAIGRARVTAMMTADDDDDDAAAL